MAILELSDGKMLSYREDGSGPPLVLVHGSPGESGSWRRVTPFLKDRFRVLAVDLPGYGSSAKVTDDPVGRTALIGGLVARLADSCGAPVRLVGHSFGGSVALQAALQAQAGTIDRMVLFEPVFFRALELTDDPALGPGQTFFHDYSSRALAGEDGVVRLMIDYWFGAGAYARMPDPVRGYLNANARSNAIDVRSGFYESATAAQLAAFDKPVLVACGDKSPEIVRDIGRGLLKLLPQARMEAIAGANHGMLDAHPEAVARLIAA